AMLALTVDAAMTTEPVTILPEQLAVEAVHLMEDRPSQISVLPVVDDDRSALGLVRLHDLVRAGVA
ncbi:MAG: CBS domain-containing protein, partial [Myxococcales bacterium]|nr:CBS domain-containing protein [Myxococcales bacterium]